jgi:prepilin peptidase CpaA
MQSLMLGVIAIGVFAVIAYDDVRSRRIPNALSLAIAILGLTKIVLGCNAVAAAQTLAAASIVLSAMFLLFWRGLIGGGDAKLIAATALLVGWHELFRFLFLMSVCGGALALITLVHHQFRRCCRSHQSRQASGGGAAGRLAEPLSVPYGVAVAAAGITSLLLEAPLPR